MLLLPGGVPPLASDSLTLMTATTLVFSLVVLGTLAQVLAAIGSRAEFRRGTRAVVGAAVVIVWLLIPATLALSGRLDRYAPLPAPALMMVLALALATIALVSSPLGRSLSRLSLVWLIGFQSFRIAVEWWLHRLYLDGLVPVEMTYSGLNFDIVSGLTALGLGFWLALGEPPRILLRLWNVLGLLLLINIVAIAVLSTPVPFRYFTTGPANRLPSIFPHVWLPSFLVQVALAGHLLVFRALRGDARR